MLKPTNPKLLADRGRAIIGLGFLAIALTISGFIGFIRFAQKELRDSALRSAVLARDSPAAAAALCDGADPNAPNRFGLLGGTPLVWAVRASDVQMVKTLLAGGAGPNVRFRGTPPLHVATSPETAALLVDAGADLDARDRTGATALSQAKARGNQALVRWLKARGAK